ncbi:phenol hydroxylase subunit [Paraglaciecola sp. MB-3u-78]|uniref:phenol hydroxylase subunit n=1 Tax=Paraglaciecola sp. MB-3u-78 TaxID=2058332 RepID=UPI001E2DF857|nr:phenol hydroxylase subunit [Paraglaciecola sp. MB-3u-78]
MSGMPVANHSFNITKTWFKQLNNMTANINKNKFNAFTRYVRVRSAPEDIFVEFDFAIEYPELYVELALPKAAFELFCKHNNVVHMDEDMAKKVDEDAQKWRFGDTRKI